MKLLLIGDSILCNYAFGDQARTKATLNVKEVDIFRVQSMASYITAFDTIKNYDTVIISTIIKKVSSLENKWPNSTMDDEKSKEVVDLISECVKFINEAAIANPNTKLSVIPPTIRTNPKWISDNFEEFKEFYTQSLNSKVIKAADPPISEVDLRADGVHYKDLPLIRFREYIKEIIHPTKSWAEEVATSNPIRSPSPTRSPEPMENGNGMIRLSDVQAMFKQLLDQNSSNGRKIDVTDEKLSKVTQDTKDLYVKHHINAAKLKEDIDALHNGQRRHMIVIKKVTKVEKLVGKDYKEKAAKFLPKLREMLNALPQVNMPKPNILSLYIIPILENDNFYQDLRITCQTQRDAIEIRNRVLNARQSKIKPWINAEVSNDPVKSTWVRIFLLQCIARKHRPTFDGKIMVNKFSDSPNILYKKNGRIIKQLSFVDAVVKHGNIISEEDRVRAKRIAGRAYEGSLKEYFLILKEDNSPVNIVDEVEILEAQGSASTTSASANMTLSKALKRKLSESTLDKSKKKQNLNNI